MKIIQEKDFIMFDSTKDLKYYKIDHWHVGVDLHSFSKKKFTVHEFEENSYYFDSFYPININQTKLQVIAKSKNGHKSVIEIHNKNLNNRYNRSLYFIHYGSLNNFFKPYEFVGHPLTKIFK